MKNYLLANFRMHHFLKFGLQKACKYSKIHANLHAICAKKYFFFLPNFFGKMASPQPVKGSISKIYTI